MRTLVVTGATGYVGRALCKAASRCGWRVVAACRRAPSDASAWTPYALERDLRAEDFPPGATLVHLACATAAGASDESEAIDAAAMERLLAVAAVREMAVIFVSSFAARRDAPTAYGRSKWRIEQRVLEAGGRVIRPGLVYGGAPGGVFSQLCGLIERIPVIPALVLPTPRVQPIHVQDLAACMLALAASGERAPAALNAGAADALPFTRFLATLARVRLRRARVRVPVPARAVALGTSALAALGRTRERERLRSLLDLPVRDTAHDLATLGVTLRPLSAGMHRSGDDRRRGLLRESRTLLRYVLASAPPGSVVRRYVRWLEATRGAPRALVLPAIARRWPAAVALLDRRGPRVTEALAELHARVDAAVAIAEASPAGASRFLRAPRGGAAGAVLTLAAAAGSEATARIAGALLSPWLRRAVRAP